jgi:hypothetical protein
MQTGCFLKFALDANLGDRRGEHWPQLPSFPSDFHDAQIRYIADLHPTQRSPLVDETRSISGLIEVPFRASCASNDLFVGAYR